MLGLITVLAILLRPYLDLVDIALVYLLPVLFSAVRWGTGPAVFAAVVGLLTFDFFFIPPTLTFTVANLRYLISFAIFLLVALLTGTLSARLRQQVIRSRQRETRTAALYALSSEIAAVADLNAVLESVARKVADTVEGKVLLLLPDKSGKLLLQASSAALGDSLLVDNEWAVATWVYEHNEIAGRGTDTLGGASGLYIPLRTEQGARGVLGVWFDGAERYLQPEQRRLLEAFAGLAAVALARIQLTEQAREAQLLAESESLRTSLFNALSHDLRTPLASIIGSVTGLLEEDSVYTPDARRDLLQNIKQGATRMNRLINNLMDMARLESGMLQLHKEWCDIQDIIGVALGRLDELLKSRPVEVHIQPDMPLLRADCVLIEQVLVNLLDNALKFSETGSEIVISASSGKKLAEVSVADRGLRIPAEDMERVFDKFYRLHSPRQVSGTGLGLAICKGIIEAHGGQIWASDNPAGGVIITFILPLADEGPGSIPEQGKGGSDGN
jgi:two-component system sensor histidine kinase KdpD